MGLPAINAPVMDFRHSSSVSGIPHILAGFPVVTVAIMSVMRLAPVPACGLSMIVIGTFPLIMGRTITDSIRASTLALDASFSKGKSENISSNMYLADALACSAVGCSGMLILLRFTIGSKYSCVASSYPGADKIDPSGRIVGVSITRLISWIPGHESRAKIAAANSTGGVTFMLLFPTDLRYPAAIVILFFSASIVMGSMCIDPFS